MSLSPPENKLDGETRGTPLKRGIGTVTATAFVVANMVGAGIFTTSGIMAAQLPDSGWVIVCWVLGGLVAVSGAACYGELATRMPLDGGEYLYLRKLFHPVAGFLTGWTSFVVGFSVPIAASSIACSLYITTSVGLESYMADQSSQWLMNKGIAVLLIVAFTGVHYMGHRIGSVIQNILTLFKVLLVLGLAVLGLLGEPGSWSRISFSGDPSGETVAWGTAMMFVMFAYSGWNASAYFAGELRNPRRSLPISLFVGTGLVIVIYIAVNLFIFRTLPYSETQGVITVVEVASRQAFGEGVGELLGAIVGIALLSSLSAFVMIGPRVYFAMARDGMFFRWASQVHSRYGVPSRSIAIQGGLAVLMVLVGSFDQLLIYLGFALSIFPWLAVAGLVIARKRGIGDGTAVRAVGYPFTPIFFLLASLALMVAAYVNRPIESTCAVITVAVGVPIYFFWSRRAKRANRTGM